MSVASNTDPICSIDLEMMQTNISKLFIDADSARSVGQRFLELHPDQAHLTLLLDGISLIEHVPDSFTITNIDHLIRNDFSSSNTVLIDGWILAKSEISLCAILALS